MKRTFSKREWEQVEGAAEKPKRLKLVPDQHGLFICPLSECDSNSYKTQRGCRKHVVEKHGWYFYFDIKPKLEDAFPEKLMQPSSKLSPTRSKTWDMPSFSDKCPIAQDFVNWICSAGGGGKDRNQAQQICKRILKFSKYCCKDLDESHELTKTLLEYCVGSVQYIEQFVIYLEKDCKVGKPGIVSYLQALAHCLDFLRYQGISPNKIALFMTSEIFLSRAKQCLRKQMKVEWNTLLSIETLESKNCWATLEEMQSVIPFYKTRYKQIINLARTKNHSSHDLSFATSFVVALLFLEVKGTRPMTHQFLTVPMIVSAYKDCVIDQTKFKTNEKYGFDSLIFDKETMNLIKDYVDHVRPKLKPSCQFLLICRNGKQLGNIGDVLGRLVYQAIGKYINPTRYRQIIETESAKHLTVEEQAIVSLDQKHTSNVAKVYYQKQRSREVAKKSTEYIKSMLKDDSKTDDGSIDSSASEDEDCSSTNAANNVVESDENQTTSRMTRSRSKVPELVSLPKSSPCQTQKRQKKHSFTKEEDSFIADGLKKYGKGKWTNILKDPDYKFHPSRKNSSLMTRAKSINLICCYNIFNL